MTKSWFQETDGAAERQWEQFYRNRFQHDKRVRTTHGVNCTGSCSWEVYVKDGIVTWETQATDYPLLCAGLPPYEPRGCQRGISYSWYLYSPMRVKYPYMRGALLDLWQAERSRHADPVAAWEALQADPAKRLRYQQARGKGGFRRVRWQDALELVAGDAGRRHRVEPAVDVGRGLPGLVGDVGLRADQQQVLHRSSSCRGRPAGALTKTTIGHGRIRHHRWCRSRISASRAPGRRA